MSVLFFDRPKQFLHVINAQHAIEQLYITLAKNIMIKAPINRLTVIGRTNNSLNS